MAKKREKPSRISKVLVANRGEIAVRVVRACRELGLDSVAVYSDVDRSALHVRYAHEAFPIGPGPARESYLVIEKTIEAAKKSGADAIHPGYGFLSERADFAQAAADEGIIFIGPTPDAITRMGDKQAARQTVQEAGVPVVPGTEPGLSDDELAAAAEQEVGFPLLIKAAAGGGGKGMRRADNMDEFANLLAGAHREAEAYFGDGTVYLEKLIEDARHIEFQILADEHGRTIHLSERECSIQRRHQKLVEEAPSSLLDDALRRKMGRVAIRAAQSVDYVNAGTVEFLVDKDKNFYFLEMNTRLQVEHPVTELVTGVDIVKEQIRIARGRRLLRRERLGEITGWAIECRINAEDPYNDFLPSTGQITDIVLPSGPGIRLDTGVMAGSVITPHYDPLLTKLICWGETRAEAILRMRRALDEYRIMGIKTNIPFHQNLLDSARFLGGQIDTSFVEERFSMDERQKLRPEVAAIMAALTAHRASQKAAQVVAPGERDTSNWKWVSRWERIHR